MRIGFWRESPMSSARKRTSHVPSRTASTAAFTSASAVDVATHGCCWLDHDTSPCPMRRQKPEVERCMLGSLAYDESQYPSFFLSTTHCIFAIIINAHHSHGRGNGRKWTNTLTTMETRTTHIRLNNAWGHGFARKGRGGCEGPNGQGEQTIMKREKRCGSKSLSTEHKSMEKGTY
ncbi:hypothetical protein BCR44DRAFT_236324 [Catenaria anguillulae PL171]|uniref:Uncharacterized protein n=1 Tax=Catenaria anguillulae PL171 TaxID=765915 RepID=A0A1Y2H784_9FUNG|nr:hypothetical protein BCR44DRAFT_236324 [Catenaria anguillulae PL171]